MSQEFGSNVLDLIKLKGFYPDEYISDLESLKKNCQVKKSLIFRWQVKKNSDKGDMVKHKLPVASYECKAYKHELKLKSSCSNPRVASSNPRVKS